MKKVLALVIMLSGMACAFSQTAGKEPETRYTSAITVGYNYSGGCYKADEGDGLDYGINSFKLNYFGITSGGILFNAGVKLGAFDPEIDPGYDFEVQRKAAAGIELGAGYAFVNNKKAKLALEAVYEYSIQNYEIDSTESTGFDSWNAKVSGIGVNLTGFIYFTNWFGFHSALGLRYMSGTVGVWDHVLLETVEHDCSSMQVEFNAGISFKF